MVIAMSGATGFIGRSLLQRFNRMEWNTRIITRESLRMPDPQFTEQMIDGADMVINLAGAPVAARWTPEYKKEILESRVNTTRRISQAIASCLRRPAVFISASAIGIYDSENTHTEQSQAYAGTFLAQVCQAWEQEALRVAALTRTVILRTGVVLGSQGGALEKMHGPFSIGLGGKIGNGRQAVSFIHIDDLVDAILFIRENPSLDGIVNAVAPYPTDNREFTEKLAKALKQPAWMTVPAFILKMIYGEGACIMLDGQRVIPEKLQEAGFRFSYPFIQNALVKTYR